MDGLIHIENPHAQQGNQDQISLNAFPLLCKSLGWKFMWPGELGSEGDCFHFSDWWKRVLKCVELNRCWWLQWLEGREKHSEWGTHSPSIIEKVGILTSFGCSHFGLCVDFFDVFMNLLCVCRSFLPGSRPTLYFFLWRWLCWFPFPDVCVERQSHCFHRCRHTRKSPAKGCDTCDPILASKGWSQCGQCSSCTQTDTARKRIRSGWWHLSAATGTTCCWSLWQSLSSDPHYGIAGTIPPAIVAMFRGSKLARQGVGGGRDLPWWALCLFPEHCANGQAIDILFQSLVHSRNALKYVAIKRPVGEDLTVGAKRNLTIWLASG